MAKCKICRCEYVKRSMSHKVCSVQCAIEAGQLRKEKVLEQRAREIRKDIKVRKEAAKSLSDLAKDAEHYVNRYVRLRDYHKGCCSCDLPATWGGQWHCSHYISVGASSALRFNLKNLAKSCSQCNGKKGGNIVEYGKRMSTDRRDFLTNHERSRRFSREYLIRLKTIFAKRCRRLEKRLGLR